MLDPESILFTEIANKARSRFKGIRVYPEETESPAAFPCLTFVQSSNTTYRRSLTGDNVEHHINLMYTANAYSNITNGAKQQCKEIIAFVDDIMRSHGFLRTMDEQMPNQDRTISRRTARWSGILGKDGYVYKP